MNFFRVHEQKICPHPAPDTYADGQVQFARLRFEFTPDWDGLDKTAQFTQGEKTYHMHLGQGTPCSCFLPAEITEGGVLLSVFGVESGGVTVATTAPILLRVKKSGYEKDGETPIPPTPDLYAQLLAQIDNKIASVKDGKSAYEIAVDEGFEGTEQEWLASLKGADGNDGAPGKDGAPGADGQDGADGADGKSAYQIWLEAGNSGTEKDFLASLKGEKGDPGESPDVSEIQAAAENAEATAANANSIAEAVQADLVNYYKKTDTYSKDEVDQMISSIPKFSVAVVSALPASDISDTTVYLVKSGDETGNLYTEYIYVGGMWEQLGTQSLDLSGYYKSTQVDSLLNGKVDKVSGKGLSTEDFTTAYKGKLDGIETGANKTTVDTALSDTSTNPVQNKAVKTALDGKAASNHTHDYLPLDGNAASATKLQTARKVNGIAFDGTGDIQIPLRCARAYANVNPSSAPWFKVASWTSSTNAYSSSEISFYAIEGIASSSTEIGGILRAKIRQRSTSGVTESVSLTWLYATGGINPDNYVATYTNNSDSGTVTLDLWVKLNGTYHSTELYVLGTYKDVYPSSYEWTLYTPTSGSATYAGDGSVVSTLATTQNPQFDTGWVSITLGTMFSDSSWLKCRKVGKAVHLQGELCPASTGIPGYTLMLSTNLTYPPDTTRTLYPVNMAGKPMQIQLSAGSGITIFSPESGYTTDSNWIIDTTYFTAE